jgi:hypothetical protein
MILQSLIRFLILQILIIAISKILKEFVSLILTVIVKPLQLPNAQHMQMMNIKPAILKSLINAKKDAMQVVVVTDLIAKMQEQLVAEEKLKEHVLPNILILTS